MELLKLKGRIEKAIQSYPYEYDPLNDLFNLCREYEKVDFDIAHDTVYRSPDDEVTLHIYPNLPK